MQGSLESVVDGRTLLYQLVMVQAVCEKRSDFSQVPALVNNHPMLQESAQIDAKSAQKLYEKLLVHYGVVQEEKDEEMPDADAEVIKDETETASMQEQIAPEGAQGETSEANEVKVEDFQEEQSGTASQNQSEEQNELKPQLEETQPETTKADSKPEVSTPPISEPADGLESATTGVEPVAERGTTPPSTDTNSDVVNLDKLVNILYMRYTHELLQTIESDKKEFTEILSDIKP